MQQEQPPILSPIIKIEQIKNDSGECLGIASQDDKIVQIFTNRMLAIYSSDCSQVMEVEKDIQHCCWAHPNSLHNNYLFLFGQQIVVIDVEKCKTVQTIKTETNFCGDSNIWNEICTAHDKTLVFWDLRQKTAFNCILAHSMRITSCKYNQTGKYITTAGQDNFVRVFDSYQTSALTTISTSKKTHCTSSQFLNDSKHLLVTTLSQPITLWEWSQCQQIAYYELPQQTRYYIEPIVIYDEEDIPITILCPNDEQSLFKFDFLNPDVTPQRQDLQLQLPKNPKPVRIERNRYSKNANIYLYQDREIYKTKIV